MQADAATSEFLLAPSQQAGDKTSLPIGLKEPLTETPAQVPESTVAADAIPTTTLAGLASGSVTNSQF
jgi:hypothetical protein